MREGKLVRPYQYGNNHSDVDSNSTFAVSRRSLSLAINCGSYFGGTLVGLFRKCVVFLSLIRIEQYKLEDNFNSLKPGLDFIHDTIYLKIKEELLRDKLNVLYYLALQ